MMADLFDLTSVLVSLKYTYKLIRVLRFSAWGCAETDLRLYVCAYNEFLTWTVAFAAIYILINVCVCAVSISGMCNQTEQCRLFKQ